MRRRSTELRTQAEEINYLNTLRTALKKEMSRRDQGSNHPMRLPVPAIENLDILRVKTMPAVQKTTDEEVPICPLIKHPFQLAVMVLAQDVYGKLLIHLLVQTHMNYSHTGYTCGKSKEM